MSPYINQVVRQPVSVVVVRERLERAKDDPIQLIKFLEQAEGADNSNIAEAATRVKHNMLADRNNVTLHDTYQFLFRHADYFAERGGFRDG